MVKRNRAEGWQHSKLSGHSNEELAKSYVEQGVSVQQRILSCYGATGVSITKVDIGGLNEQLIDSVLGDKTKSKPDMHITLSDGRQIKVSIKKSKSGQVYLITVDRFIDGFEKAYHPIPDDVKEAIRLFWGDHPDIDSISKNYSSTPIIRKYEQRKGRLVHKTLSRYDESLDIALLKWFKDNIVQLCEFCFSRGLAKNEEDWADIVWYINLVDDDVELDDMFTINSISDNLNLGTVEYGNKGGGTTIQLPFGFVQWHNPGNKGINNLQFHHRYDKILKLLKNGCI